MAQDQVVFMTAFSKLKLSIWSDWRVKAWWESQQAFSILVELWNILPPHIWTTPFLLDFKMATEMCLFNRPLGMRTRYPSIPCWQSVFCLYWYFHQSLLVNITLGIMKEYCKSGKYHQGQEFANIVWKQNQYNQSINTIFMKILFHQKLKEQAHKKSKWCKCILTNLWFIARRIKNKAIIFNTNYRCIWIVGLQSICAWVDIFIVISCVEVAKVKVINAILRLYYLRILEL